MGGHIDGPAGRPRVMLRHSAISAKMHRTVILYFMLNMDTPAWKEAHAETGPASDGWIISEDYLKTCGLDDQMMQGGVVKDCGLTYLRVSRHHHVRVYMYFLFSQGSFRFAHVLSGTIDSYPSLLRPISTSWHTVSGNGPSQARLSKEGVFF